MARSLSLITAAASTPITLAEAKAQVRVETDVTNEDDLLTTLIEAATDLAETHTGLQLVSATWELAVDSFADIDRLPKVPLASITSIKYDDTDGVEQTVSTSVYGLQTPLRTHGSVFLKDGQGWPSDASSDPGSVRVRYVAGFGDAEDVPAVIKAGIKLLVGHWFENREASVVGVSVSDLPMGVQACFSAYSVAGCVQ